MRTMIRFERQAGAVLDGQNLESHFKEFVCYLIVSGEPLKKLKQMRDIEEGLEEGNDKVSY